MTDLQPADHRLASRLEDASVKVDQFIGGGHAIRLFGWHPDRSIPANRDKFKDMPDVDRVGLIEYHLDPNGELCGGAVYFDTPEAKKVVKGKSYWKIEQEDPLTLSPSIECRSCKAGSHGYIRNGEWQEA